MKMTKAQEKLLNEIKNTYDLYQSMIDKDGGKAMDGVSPCWWVENFKKGLIEIQKPKGGQPHHPLKRKDFRK